MKYHISNTKNPVDFPKDVLVGLTERYWTIAFPGECGQHVQETWSEKQILSSAWYNNWVMKVVQTDRAYLIEDNQNALDDWKIVHWAVETDEFGRDLLSKS